MTSLGFSSVPLPSVPKHLPIFRQIENLIIEKKRLNVSILQIIKYNDL